ncbi:MAG TPA: TIGR03758 family integrating conjugative element protein [Crenotrichaceae bacterium]|nr:TIGR03758 family integrating conjugative element protein [Crenotrichaceae bacterium]
MAMSDPQKTIFTATSTVSPDVLTTVIASVLMTAALLWLAWMAYSQLRLWQSDQSSFYDLSVNIARSCIIVLLLGFFIN